MTLDLAYPFTGSWLTQNSPADHVPSHGTTMFATAYAIDFVPVDEGERTAPFTLASLLRPDPAERFPGFGRPILAPVAGVVVAAHDLEPDHRAYRGIPSVGYALTQASRVRQGWIALAGNHVLIDTGTAVVALCHLQRGSARVRPGRRVGIGEMLGRCGNSGNSTEPHLHLQALDTARVEQARAVPLSFRGALPHNGDVVHA
ncbi:M23 family metallopeptidase [Granulicoccus phenolivorans]|uniref:M23 family metallopeptidase n=1 Tax=Granulicoccus phenolivorans TaxID=266854 RepID=UPI0003FCFA94|nr:M23 family metallopeptidase [Granulicoccus phenolivorans]